MLKYFITLIVLFLIALIPGAVTIGFVLLFLPGLALLLSGTLLMYSLLAVGVWNIFPQKSAKWIKAAAVLACLAPFAFGMPLFSRNSFESLVADYRQSDVEQGDLSPPKRLAIGYQTNRTDRDITALECGMLCATALLSGKTKEVVIFNPNDQINKSNLMRRSGMRFRIEKRPLCQEYKMLTGAWQNFTSFGYEEFPDRHRIILARIAGGECVIGEEAKDADIDTIVLLADNSGYKRPNQLPRWSYLEPDVTEIKQIRIGRPTQDGITWPVIRTQVEGQPLAPIFYIGTPYSYGMMITLGWGRVQRAEGKFNFGPFVEAKLGYPALEMPSDEDRREVVKTILRRDGGEYTDSEIATIRSYVDEVVRVRDDKHLDPDEIEVIRLLITDTRKKSHMSMDLSRYAHQLTPLAPTIIQRLRDTNAYPLWGIATTLSAMPIETLAQYEQDIATILSQSTLDNDLWARSRLAARAGELGPSMAAPIMQMLDIPPTASNHHNITRWLAQGMCRIGKDADEYAPRLSERAQKAMAAGKKYEALAFTLAVIRMGKAEQVSAVKSKLDNSFFGNKIKALEADLDPVYCDIHYRPTQ